MKTKIIIAMHKPYPTPDDAVYLPLQVGAAGKEAIARRAPVEGRTRVLDLAEHKANQNPEDAIARDDMGENISAKNPSYCELTGLYWAWKNLDADAIGLVHYRRYFAGMNHILSGVEAESLMDTYDIIVPKKRRYYIESLYSHYAHTLDGTHLDFAREIIHHRCPEYDAACDVIYRRTWGYMFNMCILRREQLDAYCTWLFPILEELEDALTSSGSAANLSTFEARLYGRVSEILLNVWLYHARVMNPELRICEVATLHTEPVNWVKKGTAFLQAKFFGKKYKESF